MTTAAWPSYRNCAAGGTRRALSCTPSACWSWMAPTCAGSRSVRKATLASLLRKSRHGVRFNEHVEHPDGIAVFQHACSRMGLEGIVSKQLGSRYRSGRSPDWLKFKNPGPVSARCLVFPCGSHHIRTGLHPRSICIGETRFLGQKQTAGFLAGSGKSRG